MTRLDEILNKYKQQVADFLDGWEIDRNLYEELYSYYLNSGEMPYGTAKARDEDPEMWIMQRLERDYA